MHEPQPWWRRELGGDTTTLLLCLLFGCVLVFAFAAGRFGGVGPNLALVFVGIVEGAGIGLFICKADPFKRWRARAESALGWAGLVVVLLLPIVAIALKVWGLGVPPLLWIFVFGSVSALLHTVINGPLGMIAAYQYLSDVGSNESNELRHEIDSDDASPRVAR